MGPNTLELSRTTNIDTIWLGLMPMPARGSAKSAISPPLTAARLKPLYRNVLALRLRYRGSVADGAALTRI